MKHLYRHAQYSIACNIIYFYYIRKKLFEKSIYDKYPNSSNQNHKNIIKINLINIYDHALLGCIYIDIEHEAIYVRNPTKMEKEW